MAAFKNRIERLELLLRALPSHTARDACPDAGALLGRHAGLYADKASPAAQRRAIQRDLEELVRDGRADTVNPGGKPLRYRRAAPLAAESDPLMLEYARKSLQVMVAETVPVKRFDALWQRLLDRDAGLPLGDDKVRILSDTQRLLPADIRPDVLVAVLEALSTGRTLEASYVDKAGKRTRPTLHPQAILQRGPLIYLYALKNDEDQPVRVYALQRLTSAHPGNDDARGAAGFDLQHHIDHGLADFARGDYIALAFKARGYVADLLRDCPLEAGQIIEDLPDGDAFDIMVRADIPQTGQLLRWLLGFGDKVQVVAPEAFRLVVKSQAEKLAGLYQ